MKLPAYIYKQSPPEFSLRVGGLPASPTLSSRISALNVSLYDGRQSDQLSLTLDVSNGSLGQIVAVPATGKELDIYLGYKLHKVLMGKFTVDQVGLQGSGSGQSMNITAVPFLLLQERSRTFADTTIGDIVDKIAKQNDLKAQTSISIKSKEVEIENQTNETDLSFLTRLAKKYDCVMKPAVDRLLFLSKGAASNASGVSLLPVIIGPSDIMQWSTHGSDRSDFKAVVAYWYDPLQAALQEEISGTSSRADTHRISHVYSNQQEARAAVKAKSKELSRSTRTLNLTVVGDPSLVACGSILLKDVHSSVNGSWITSSVTHSLTTSGYQSTISAYEEE